MPYSHSILLVRFMDVALGHSAKMAPHGHPEPEWRWARETAATALSRLAREPAEAWDVPSPSQLAALSDYVRRTGLGLAKRAVAGMVVADPTTAGQVLIQGRDKELDIAMTTDANGEPRARLAEPRWKDSKLTEVGQKLGSLTQWTDLNRSVAFDKSLESIFTMDAAQLLGAVASERDKLFGGDAKAFERVLTELKQPLRPGALAVAETLTETLSDWEKAFGAQANAMAAERAAELLYGEAFKGPLAARWLIASTRLPASAKGT